MSVIFVQSPRTVERPSLAAVVAEDQEDPEWDCGPPVRQLSSSLKSDASQRHSVFFLRFLHSGKTYRAHLSEDSKVDCW